MGALRVLRLERPSTPTPRALAREVMVDTRDELELSPHAMAARLTRILGEPVTAGQVLAYEDPRCIPPGDLVIAAMLLRAEGSAHNVEADPVTGLRTG
jgi:hypothetical protein